MGDRVESGKSEGARNLRAVRVDDRAAAGRGLGDACIGGVHHRVERGDAEKRPGTNGPACCGHEDRG
ncbi:hypothetical protein GCM10023080_089180 [Streptomyces pseudoechinosporeus]